jgi:hypothetical protein
MPGQAQVLLKGKKYSKRQSRCPIDIVPSAAEAAFISALTTGLKPRPFKAKAQPLDATLERAETQLSALQATRAHAAESHSIVPITPRC